jgi:UDP-glucuronate 4-epimerase
VTGGAGFIGSHLIDRLLEKGKEVVCLDNFDDFYDPRIKRENTKPHLKAKEHQVEQFIFASSSSVYGAKTKVPFKEENRLRPPLSPYAVSKRGGELLSYTYSHLYNLPVTILRLFTVYGPRQRPEMAIHKFIRLIDEGGEIPMFGDGTSQRDYTYISDIIEGIISALEKEFSYEIFNLGNSRTIKLKDLISLVEKNLKKKAKVKELPQQPGEM